MVSPRPADDIGQYSRAEKVELRKAVGSAFMGTVIEWYDFFLYGTAAALVFPKLFFPDSSPQAGTMKAFATYAVGFFARPVGSILFGYLGDKIGRKFTLYWTLSLMGGATFLIGCLPSYAMAGVWAPILLVLLRFGQGLAIGGEWGGAALMTVEHGHKGRRGWYGSWAQIGVPAGVLLANGIFALTSSGNEGFFMEWGWRICFWFGIVLTLLGLFVRKSVSETPLFKKNAAEGRAARNPLREALRLKWRMVLVIIGARMAENAGFYIFSVYVLAYARGLRPGLEVTVLQGMLLGAGLEVFTIPAFGALSDKIGRRAVSLLGCVLFTVGIFPFFAALDSQSAPQIWLAMGLAFALVHGAMYAPMPAFYAEMFPTAMRYSGASLGYGISAALAGGLAPMIAAYLVQKDGGLPWWCASYLAVMGVISIVAISLAKETHRKNISDG